jgi:hypothetical protein
VEFYDIGATRVVLLKKCASSTLFQQLQHQRNTNKGDTRRVPPRYVLAFIRDPYARLVSGWADLVRRQQLPFAIPTACRDGEEFDFENWARQIIKIPDDELDHHFRPQTIELLDALDQTELQKDTQLVLGRVEKLASHLMRMHSYLGGEAIDIALVPRVRATQRRATQHYYTNEDLRARVHARFLHDEMLCGIVKDPLHISPYYVDPRKYLKTLLKIN